MIVHCNDGSKYDAMIVSFSEGVLIVDERLIISLADVDDITDDDAE